MTDRRQRHRPTAVFVDRDGTLIRDPGYPDDPTVVQLRAGRAGVLHPIREVRPGAARVQPDRLQEHLVPPVHRAAQGGEKLLGEPGPQVVGHGRQGARRGPEHHGLVA